MYDPHTYTKQTFCISRATTCTTSSPEKPEQGSQSTTLSIKFKYFNILELLLFSSTLPMPEEFGMDLAPNTASSIAVQLNQINRQPDPYSSHCVDSWENTGINVPEGMEYSLALCQRMCHQKTITERCNCYWPSLSLPSFNENSTGFSTFGK